MKKALVVGILSLSLLPALVLAQPPGITPLPTGELQEIGDVVEVVRVIADIIFTILMLVAVVFILFAAYYYLTAGGDPTKVTKAHNMLIYAAVAIAVALVAQGVEAIVRSVLEGRR